MQFTFLILFVVHVS